MAGKLFKYQSYRAWHNMRSRCYNKNVPCYSRYGGRGVTVCDRWLGEHGYTNFLADMGEPLPGLSLDRIDNDEAYSPNNCRWATVYEQMNNRRVSKNITINGITMTLAEWSRLSQIKPSTIRQRLYVYKWTPEKSLEINI